MSFQVDRSVLGQASAGFADLGTVVGGVALQAVRAMADLGQPWGDDVVGEAFAARYREPARAATFNALEQEHQIGAFADLVAAARAAYEFIEAANEAAGDGVGASVERGSTAGGATGGSDT